MFSRVGLFTLGRRLVGDLETPTNGPIIQVVRWRKRRWAPKNPSKIYYVRTPTAEIPEEKAELQQRYRHHKTTMKALREYFKEEVALKESMKSSKVQTDKEEAEWAELKKINDGWNRQTAVLREARQAEEERVTEEERRIALAAVEEEKLKKLLQAQRAVEKEIKQAKHFINQDDLQSEIEKALNMRVSYNFAIDKDGNRYVETADGSTVAETKEADTVRRFEQPVEEKDVKL